MQKRAQSGQRWWFDASGRAWCPRLEVWSLAGFFPVLFPLFLAAALGLGGFGRCVPGVFFLARAGVVVGVVIEMGRRSWCGSAHLLQRIALQAGDFAQALAHQGAQVG